MDKVEKKGHNFEPARVEDLNMDPIGESVVNLLRNASKLRHLIMRDITEIDWILLIAELWPLFAQLHTLELGYSTWTLGLREKVEPGRPTDKVPLYQAASRLREAIRLEWLSVGRRDLLPDDIRRLVKVPELVAAKAFMEDDYVSSAVCNAWNQSNDKGPPIPTPHPMKARYRAYLQNCDDAGGIWWKSGFFDKVNEEWDPVGSAAIRENN